MLQRLQKIIAQAGIASRRHAEELIRSGQVRVNGAIVTELGSKADPEHDRVEVAGRVAEVPEERVYILLNKPSEVVSTLADPEGRKTLRHFLRGTPERVFPVGRLDYAASGLVLLTSDGELAARVLRAAARLRQIYWIKVKGRISETEMHDVGRAASAHFAPLKGPWAKRSAANPWYEVELTGASRDALGRSLKRQDHPIEKMKRVQLATLELGLLPEGHYRRLEPAEVDKFSRAVDRALAEKNEPAAIAPTQHPLAASQKPATQFARPIAAAERPVAPPAARPPLTVPINRPQFAAPGKPWRGASNQRPPTRPREPWRARSGNPPPRNKPGNAPHSPQHPRPGAPHHRPGAPPKQDWRGQKSGPWRGNKTSDAPRSQNHPRPGAPKHRPGAPAKNDWRAEKSAPWRGNKTGSAPAPPKKPWPGAPHHRPGAPAKNDWRARKSGPWRGNKTGGAPHSPANARRPRRPQNQGSARPAHRSNRPNRPDRDPRHTPRHSR
ncbi:MAG: pseudouridine synthase [Candidatus Acidiferrales bacterium]